MATRRVELEPTATHGQVTIFDTFALLGVFSTLAVLAPALISSRVRRSRVWYCVMNSWMVYSISFSLLLGRQTGPQPPFGICFLRAALVYVVPFL
jgi:hypothetical protein